MALDPRASRPSASNLCDKHGVFEPDDIVLGALVLHGGCPRCREAREQENLRLAIAREARERAEELERRIIASGIPPRFMSATLDSYKGVCEVATKNLGYARFVVEDFPTMLKHGASLVFTGTPGTGKTHLGCALVRALLERDYSAAYVNAMDMLSAVKDTWGQAGQRSGDVVSQFIAPQMLVIDEVGLQGQSNVDYSLLFAIINGRYERRRPMVVISNKTPKELSQHLNERVMDRLVENSEILTFEWPSFRSHIEEDR